MELTMAFKKAQREMSNKKKMAIEPPVYRDGQPRCYRISMEQDNESLCGGEYYSKGEKFPVSTIDEGRGRQPSLIRR